MVIQYFFGSGRGGGGGGGVNKVHYGLAYVKMVNWAIAFNIRAPPPPPEPMILRSIKIFKMQTYIFTLRTKSKDKF